MNKDPLSIDAVPQTRSLNRYPLIFFMSTVALAAMVVAWTVWERSEQTYTGAQSAEVKIGSTANFANMIVKHSEKPPEDIIEESPEVPPPAQPIVEEKLPTLPTLQEIAIPEDPYIVENRNRLLTARLQQFQRALESKTSSGINMASLQPREGSVSGAQEDLLRRVQDARRQAETLSQTDPESAYKMRLASLQGGGQFSGNANAPPTNFGEKAKSSLGDFDGQEGRWATDSTLRTHSPFSILAGSSVIPATLISGINSSLAGQVQAQVSVNVYDTATGKYLLIPQGTRLVGSYGSDINFGQERVLMAWQRLIFPDGRTYDLGSMPGADSAGFAGFADQVNHHYIRTFLSATLLSGIIAAVNISQEGNDDEEGSSAALSEALGQTLGQVVGQMISKNLNIAPTIEIRPGYRLNVMVAKDIKFEAPYKPLTY